MNLGLVSPHFEFRAKRDGDAVISTAVGGGFIRWQAESDAVFSSPRGVAASLRHSRGLLVSDTGARKDAVWIPKSQCEVEVKRGDVVTVTLSERTATEKGLV